MDDIGDSEIGSLGDLSEIAEGERARMRRFQGCRIDATANGWMICVPQAPAIVIEKIPGRDNIAHLLAQLAVLLGDKQ